MHLSSRLRLYLWLNECPHCKEVSFLPHYTNVSQKEWIYPVEMRIQMIILIDLPRYEAITFLLAKHAFFIEQLEQA